MTSSARKSAEKKLRGRPQVERAIDALGKAGDVLVFAEWDRAPRSMMDGVAIIERIHARGALIKVLDKPHLDLTNPIGRGFIAFLSALAEDERQRILKRANAGRAEARKRGIKFGRNPSCQSTSRRGEAAAGEGGDFQCAPRHDQSCWMTLVEDYGCGPGARGAGRHAGE
jgi:DNA invertase Pin-like site-specific DNA recombinase